jgi:UDP-N-acetyl-D-mannosaminuronic acid dehydrogenase
MIHRPSSGVGGHCIPVYPWFLINKAKELGVDAALLRQARHINDTMPQHTVELVIRCLNAQGKPVKGSRIGILGLSFRSDVKETRFASSLAIRSILSEYQPAAILAHDPYFSKDEIRQLDFTPATLTEILEADCVILIAAHKIYHKSLAKLRAVKSRLVDTTNLVSTASWKIGKIPLKEK